MRGQPITPPSHLWRDKWTTLKEEEEETEEDEEEEAYH